jgi:hypothetical protein
MMIALILFITLANANAGSLSPPSAPPPMIQPSDTHTLDEGIQYFKKEDRTTLSQKDQCDLVYLEFHHDLFPARENSFNLPKGASPKEVAQAAGNLVWYDVFHGVGEIGASQANPQFLSTLKRWLPRLGEFEKCPSPWGPPYDLSPWILYQTGEGKKAKPFYFDQLKKAMREYKEKKNESVALADFTLTYLRKLMAPSELNEYEAWLSPKKIERDKRNEQEKRGFEQLQKTQRDKTQKEDDEYFKKTGQHFVHP